MLTFALSVSPTIRDGVYEQTGNSIRSVPQDSVFSFLPLLTSSPFHSCSSTIPSGGRLNVMTGNFVSLPSPWEPVAGFFPIRSLLSLSLISRGLEQLPSGRYRGAWRCGRNLGVGICSCLHQAHSLIFSQPS